jgi:hypothetical protein
VTHPHDHPAPNLATPSDVDTRAALVLLGYERCDEHAPANPEARAAGDLAALFALVQAHISNLPAHHQDAVEMVYHNMREHVLGKPCPCGGHDDERAAGHHDPVGMDPAGAILDL